MLMPKLKNLKQLIFSVKMKKRKKERNNHLLQGSNDLFIGLIVILCRKRHRVFSFISAVSGCLLLLLFAFSVLTPPPTATNNFLSHRFSAVRKTQVEESNLDKVFKVPASGGNLGRDLWSSSQSKFYYGCSNASKSFQSADMKTHPNRYLMIATSGGLNQQRTGIIDSVVVAYILNATLIIPKLDQHSYWKDTSDFAEIFNVDLFISSLERDVEMIKELPRNVGKAWVPRSMRVPRKCNLKCYQTLVLPVLNNRHVVELTKFDYRLSNRLETDLQKLRCRVNYHALRFTDPILEMGKLLIERMRMKAKHFIALHLRFEPDMLAFSGCYYGGGEKERGELGAIRKRWETLHVRNPEKVRRHGRCPLTPEEIGLMLRALGFGSDVHIYVASGEVYGGEETLAPLKALFPNFHSKETIATKEELAPFSAFSGRLAALDYIVCDESDVFVTNNNGNMARILAGRRRYFGHRSTIRPNAKKLYKLFLDRNNMTWDEFASKVRTYQIGFMGEPKEVKPGRGEFHENPDSCICEAKSLKSSQERKDGVEVSYEQEQSAEEDHDWTDINYLDTGGLFKELPNAYSSVLIKHGQPEVEAFFSDQNEG
ncbi:protein ROOT HAIR SPECIFIC 17-like [Hibiscus syriacus]|uniref:protein ROOT HAIR SPECIFIC 17-like n=1 Tax=Hibiscus syriacus TaxID=106335 RepID=UPI001923E88D|nr:protein ROOT HAIR SPECIFIC 17-like [Hibiscus syriacus]